MLTKENYSHYLFEKRRYYIEMLYDLIDKRNLAKDLIFSYLGARICYHSGLPIEILFEDRLNDVEKRTEFFMRLKRNKHYSVFAHTPILIDLSEISVNSRERIFKFFYKLFLVDEYRVFFNLRHFAEFLPEEKFRDLINIKIYDWKNDKDFVKACHLTSNFVIDLNTIELVHRNVIYQTPILFIFNSYYPEWKVVVAHNISRCCSHQWVRHTTINFNQKSQRYTRVETFSLPKTFQKDENLINNILHILKNFYKVYKDLSDNAKFKKEELRFLAPQSSATTLIASAPIFVWRDFIEKRQIIQAQAEIREIADILSQKLFD